MAGHGRDGSHTSVELLFTEHQAMCVKDILLFSPHRTCWLHSMYFINGNWGSTKISDLPKVTHVVSPYSFNSETDNLMRMQTVYEV